MGFTGRDKVLSVHADDVGITQSSIDAFLELLDFGTISCGSAMVPAPWFPEVARKFRENSELDLGLHLTLNCEYVSYRWRPVSTISQESGFIDENGYFKQDKQEVMQTADPQSVEKEIDAQLRVALNLGLKPTHVDSHSGTLWSEKYIDSYIKFYKNIRSCLYYLTQKRMIIQ
ncbi:ChbG/HpnK family deacetylase [Bacillus sp. N9]